MGRFSRRGSTGATALKKKNDSIGRLNSIRNPVLKRIYRDRLLYIMLLPALLVTLVFAYGPMPGLVLAFKDYSIYGGIWDSPWCGFDNFVQIFTQPKFLSAIWNTLAISFLNLVIGFPAPILLALLINELNNRLFKRVVQTVSYLPHFLSWISVTGVVFIMFGRDGIINDLRMAMGATERISFLANQNLFIWFVIALMVWKEAGWGTVIHLASLSSVNESLYEAVDIDGGNRLHKLWYITIPHMLPTCIILLIFQMGTVFSSNFELIYGLQNPYIDFEVISTIVYYTGIENGNYSVSTAIGFMQGIVALILVIATNAVSKKITDTGIF